MEEGCGDTARRHHQPREEQLADTRRLFPLPADGPDGTARTSLYDTHGPVRHGSATWRLRLRYGPEYARRAPRHLPRTACRHHRPYALCRGEVSGFARLSGQRGDGDDGEHPCRNGPGHLYREGQRTGSLPAAPHLPRLSLRRDHRHPESPAIRTREGRRAEQHRPVHG